MRNRFFPILLLVGLLLGAAVPLHAQAQKTDRVNLKPKTLVSKKLDRVEDGPNGKTYVYKYRVEAQPTESEMPRYSVDAQYNVSYQQRGSRKTIR